MTIRSNINMHGLVSICLVTLALFVQGYQCIPAGEQPIKLMRIENHYWNPKYTSALDYFVTPHNRTYNNLGVHWVVSRDLPADISILLHVYVTDSEYQNAKLILTVDTPICKESKNGELLPTIAVVDKSFFGTKCLKTGTYNVKDMGQLRFEVLIPNLDKKGLYYIVHHKLHSGNETLVTAIIYNQWGLL